MFQKVKHFITYFLIAGLTLGVLSAQPAFAEETVSADNMAATDTVDTVNTADITNTVDAANTAKDASKLAYVYLDQKTVETPGTQVIIVGYGDEDTLVSDAVLTVKNYYTGTTTTYEKTDVMENAAVFEMDYSATDKGIYEITDVAITTSVGVQDQIHLRDTGMANVYFGVDEEFTEETREDVQALSTESEELTDIDIHDVELQIVHLDGNADEISTSDIADIKNTLQNAQKSRTTLQTEASRDYVVVLDPGHDSSHAGARANGLAEENVTLQIAQYCKEELEQYYHVTVYLTRSGTGCPYPGNSSVMDNKNRVLAAASVGADLYVSIHINSSRSGSPNGAEVFYPNASYRPDISSAGANLSTQILRQLTALGLSNRGISIRNSEDRSTYPDGSLADYYGVIKNSKLCGFPGIIVEHAYISNASDAAFLRSEENLKRLGIADATGIANYLELSKTPDRVADPVKVNQFVTRLYDKCLGRLPDDTGLKTWTDALCNYETDGVNVAYGFVFSREMTNRNLSDAEFVEILYRVFLDREPDEQGKQDWIYYLENGVSRYGVFMGFANSREFGSICEQYGIEKGTAKAVDGRDRNLGLTAFVARLYTKALGRSYDVNGLNDWCNAILDGRQTVTEVSTTGFFNSREFLDKNMSDSDYVKTLYRTFFDREPDEGGYNDWMNHLQSQKMNRNEVLLGFANSKEFAELKKKYGIQ